MFKKGDLVLYGTNGLCDITDVTTLTAVEASVDINDRAATPEPTMKVIAKSIGTWGNKISVKI